MRARTLVSLRPDGGAVMDPSQDPSLNTPPWPMRCRVAPAPCLCLPMTPRECRSSGGGQHQHMEGLPGGRSILVRSFLECLRARLKGCCDLDPSIDHQASHRRADVAGSEGRPPSLLRFSPTPETWVQAAVRPGRLDRLEIPVCHVGSGWEWPNPPAARVHPPRSKRLV